MNDKTVFLKYLVSLLRESIFYFYSDVEGQCLFQTIHNCNNKTQDIAYRKEFGPISYSDVYTKPQVGTTITHFRYPKVKRIGHIMNIPGSYIAWLYTLVAPEFICPDCRKKALLAIKYRFQNLDYGELTLFLIENDLNEASNNG